MARPSGGKLFQRAITITFLLLVINSAAMGAAPKSRPGSSVEELKSAFTHLKANPNDRAAQKRYLKAFPQDFRAFMALFGSGGTLADGYQCDYIFALSALQAHHAAQVGRLLVQLSKDAQYRADAPSCLQHVLANYGSRYTKSFAVFLHGLSPRERDQLITFLADIDTKVTSNLDYQHIIRNLKQLNEPELAKKFQQAQIDRARQQHG
jgi:hypothetical protein